MYLNFVIKIIKLKFKHLSEYIQTPDGGQISLDWYDPNGDGKRCQINHCTSQVHADSEKPIALFMPGVTGCSQAEYLKTFVPIAHQIGYRAVAINYRGMGNTELLTPRLYCGANDEDLRTALLHIRSSNPNAKIVATGISLGGIILSRYLISSGHDSLVDAAYLVSVVWNYLEVISNMEKGLNYQLNRFLTKSLIGIVQQHRDKFQNLPQYDLEAVQRCRTMREFDDAFTIRMFNYESTTEYYTACIPKGKMINIKKPTLCINAADDMFAPGEMLPIDEVEMNSFVAMLVTSRGGHIGFMDGFLPNLTHSYMERILEQYLTALIKLPDFRCDLTNSINTQNNYNQY